MNDDIPSATRSLSGEWIDRLNVEETAHEEIRERSVASSDEERRKTRGLIEYLRAIEPVDEDWPDISDPPPEPVEF